MNPTGKLLSGFDAIICTLDQPMRKRLQVQLIAEIPHNTQHHLQRTMNPHANTMCRTARNSLPLEVLGTYDPLPKAPRPGDTHGRPWKDIKLDISRARYWIGVGAQPSDTAWRLLSMVRLNFVWSRGWEKMEGDWDLGTMVV
jgi:ribosomal protein S16